MIQTALIVNTEELDQSKALDIEEFTEHVLKTYGRTPKFTVGADRPLMLVATSSVASPADADMLSRVFGILDNSTELDDHFSDDGWLTPDNMDKLLQARDVADAKEYIAKASYNFSEDAYYVVLTRPVFSTNVWYIKG